MTEKFAVVLGAFLFTVSFSACSGRNKAGPPTERAFRYLLQAKVTSLDPHSTTDTYSHLTQSLVYESLYEFDYFKRPMQAIPALAESLPEVSSDYKTLKIKLKKGIFFQDDACFEATQGKGRELVADDVVYLFHRIAAPKFIAPYYSNFEGTIEGIDNYHAGKADRILGIRALDSHTVEFKLTRPNPRFILGLTSTSSAVVPKECVEKYKDDFGKHAVGTGAFRIAEFGDYKIVAVKNPNYKTQKFPTEKAGPDSGKPLPLLDKVVFEVLSEDQPTWLKFLAGETEISRIPKDNFGAAVPGGKLSPELAARGVTLLKGKRGDVTVLIFNMEDPVWGKKKELRQAFALALDVPKVIELQYNGQAVRADSIVDPTSYGFDPEYRSRWHDRNIAKAKELLAKAGYPEGKDLPPLVMLSSEGATARQLYELIARAEAEIGIQMSQDVTLWAEMVRKMKEKNFTMAGMGFASDSPDVDGAFDLLISRNASPGQNSSNYKNPEYDKLADEIRKLPNSAQRLERIKKIKDVIDEDLPMMALTHRIGNQLVQPWVKNHVYADEIYLGMFMKYKDVQTAAEKK